MLQSWDAARAGSALFLVGGAGATYHRASCVVPSVSRS